MSWIPKSFLSVFWAFSSLSKIVKWFSESFPFNQQIFIRNSVAYLLETWIRNEDITYPLKVDAPHILCKYLQRSHTMFLSWKLAPTTGLFTLQFSWQDTSCQFFCFSGKGWKSDNDLFRQILFEILWLTTKRIFLIDVAFINMGNNKLFLYNYMAGIIGGQTISVMLWYWNSQPNFTDKS